MSSQNVIVPPVNVQYAEVNSLHDLLLKFQTRIGQAFNCHAIATVTSFTPSVDTGNGLARLTAQMSYNQTVLTQQRGGGFTNTQQFYPLLVDCPVVTIGAGSAVLQAPVFKGDQVMICFNDRDLTNWWSGAAGAPPATTRTHAFQDAMAIVGFIPWQINDTSHLMFANAQGAQLGIETLGALIRIANNTTTLYTCLASLINAIENITVDPGSFEVTTSSSSGVWPVTGTSGVVSDVSALTDAKNALKGLLE